MIYRLLKTRIKFFLSKLNCVKSLKNIFSKCHLKKLIYFNYKVSKKNHNSVFSEKHLKIFSKFEIPTFLQID